MNNSLSPLSTASHPKSKFLAMACLGMTCAASMGGTIFSVDHNDLGAVGGAAGPWGVFDARSGSPTVVELGGEKWMENHSATSDRLRHNNGAYGTTEIPINGATIVMALKPTRGTGGDPWNSAVDIFYDQLCIGVHNETGVIKVKISGANGANPIWTSTEVVPEEPGVLTLSVGNGGDPAFEVFWRGADDAVAVSMGTGNGNTAGQPYTALYPSVNGRNYAQYINLGGNDPDAWPSYNGLIGDTYVLDEQLTGEALLALQDQVRWNMGIGDAPGALPFAITEIQYAPDADPNPTVTLTWRSRSNTTYKAFSSLDLIDWSNELADSLGPDTEGIIVDGDLLTMSFPLENGLENDPDVFFRIQEE